MLILFKNSFEKQAKKWSVLIFIWFITILAIFRNFAFREIQFKWHLMISRHILNLHCVRYSDIQRYSLSLKITEKSFIVFFSIFRFSNITPRFFMPRRCPKFISFLDVWSNLNFQRNIFASCFPLGVRGLKVISRIHIVIAFLETI